MPVAASSPPDPGATTVWSDELPRPCPIREISVNWLAEGSRFEVLGVQLVSLVSLPDELIGWFDRRQLIWVNSNGLVTFGAPPLSHRRVHNPCLNWVQPTRGPLHIGGDGRTGFGHPPHSASWLGLTNCD